MSGYAIANPTLYINPATKVQEKIARKSYSKTDVLGKPTRPEAKSLCVERLPALVIHAVEYQRPVSESF
jgi:hypothetical protein